MKTTAKPTPGPVTVSGTYDGSRTICMMRHPEKQITVNGPEGCPPTWDECTTEANAELISEAFDVHHETGLSPRQLLDQRNALWDALENVAHYPIASTYPDGPCIKWEDMDEIKAAIAKVMCEGRNVKPEPRFENVGCSQCGQSFGPGNHGFSHCENHAGRSQKP